MAGFLSRLFGSSAAEPVALPSEEYNGFTITPAPQKTGDGYRVAATIEKDGRVHQLIRADTLRDHEGAVDASLMKAHQVIDQQGERIFD